MGCLFVETSAKTEIGVRAAFRGVIERIVEIPEPWVRQEPRVVSPSRAMSPLALIEPQADEGPLIENSERVKIIGRISFDRNMIRIGGPDLQVSCSVIR